MRWLYDNKIESATITPLTENPDLPFNTAFKDGRLSRYARTIDIEDQTIVFDLTDDYAISYVVIMGHNISASATVKIQGNDSNVWTAPDVDETLTVTSDIIIYNFSPAETYRYWRLYIDDDSNTDGYIQISKVYLGSHLQLPGMSKSQKLPTVSNSTSSDSTSGQTYMDIGLNYKTGSITFPFVTDAQYATLETAFRFLNKFKPFIMLVWESDLTFQPPIYSKLTTDLDWTRAESIVGRKWTLNFSFREVF